MFRVVKFLGVLMVCLGVLTYLAWRVVHDTTRDWWEKDINLRAQLVVNGARQGLIRHWETPGDGLKGLLTEILHDERIMGVAACNADASLLAETQDFPRRFNCNELGLHVRPAANAPGPEWKVWWTKATLPGGDVQVSTIPVLDQDVPLGFVALVHDLNFVARREGKTQRFILVAFAVLAGAASLITLVAIRLSWRSWSNELRRLVRGGGPRPEFQPLLQDVRELIDRISTEREADIQGGAWTPQRLKHTLNRHLHGEKVVILANREPYIHERTEDGRTKVLHPASGLVTALEPVMRACSGTWVAHGGGSADRATVDAKGRVKVPPGEESYVVRRVWLSPEEEKGYYYGFSNEGLWPLCHLAHTRPLFRGEDYKCYRAVNQKFADAVCEEVDSPDPIILVQDYHFALAPKMIRDRLPRATVLMFWHIPWPNSERFGICPWRNELLEGMLGSSILGFHTPVHCNNFVDSVERFMESRTDRGQSAIVHHQRATLVRPYPISVEWPNHWAQLSPPVAECRAAVFAELGLKPDALLGVGVDRLDYTKGIEERLLAVERMLERYPAFVGRFTFVQLAAPSRTVIERYQQLNAQIEATAQRINQRFGRDDYRPIVLFRAHHEPPTVFKYYRAADLCYVSSLHDGMNLVAKEFIAARDDEKGVLVLSSFTGASHELTEALIVNPYDFDEAASALVMALNMSVEEQQDRMRSMRSFVAEFNVYRWAGRMLVDAARLRRRDRLTGRLSEHLLTAEGG
ncbi:MAG: trehalose-6-phosphate synthase [Myxococcaceae bacterium]|nr:trehalose-6-phosphate synthase [Myxococcaceae bacterium]